MLKFFVLVSIYLATSSAFPEIKDWRIVGGNNAEPGAYPFIVSLRRPLIIPRSSVDVHYCGGSILNDRWILTAAHCAYYTSTVWSYVVAGSNTLDPGGDKYDISAMFVHPNFTMEMLQNDVALLRLSAEIKFSKNVSAVTLPSSNIGALEKVVIAGWGSTTCTINPEIISNNLQQLNLTTISVSKCKEWNSNRNMTITETQLCTLNKEGEGVCLGDSGGPLVSPGPILQGIVSRGQLYCALGYPDVYSRVYSFISWIEETIKANNVTIT